MLKLHNISLKVTTNFSVVTKPITEENGILKIIRTKGDRKEEKQRINGTNGKQIARQYN